MALEETTTMGFEHTITALGLCIQTRTPALVIGSVGEAKTAIVESLFEQIGVDHETSICALHEPTEYGGFPVPGPDGVRLQPVAWVNRLAKVPDEKGNITGLFLDELSNGAPATRSAAMRGILDGTWGEKTIPTLTTVAAMNPPEMAESGYDLSAPLATRFCHFAWDMPEDYWTDAMMSGFPAPKVTRLPSDWRQHIPWASGLVAAFGKSAPGNLKTLPGDRADRARPFATYRTWTFAMNLLGACRACGFDLQHDVTMLLLSGCVGSAAASTFSAYAQTADFPDPEQVLKNPEKLTLPDRGDLAYAVLGSVVAAVARNRTRDRWYAGWKVLGKAKDRRDLAFGAAQRLVHLRPDKTWPAPAEMEFFVPLMHAAGLM